MSLQHPSSRRARRARISALAIVLVAVFSGCARSMPPELAPRAAEVRRTPPNPVADELLRATNERRAAAGLPRLTRNEELMVAAQLQAEQMAQAGRMDHELRDSPFPTLMTRLEAVAYPTRAAGENIAAGYRNVGSALAGWMASDGHRANILSHDYVEIGTGVATSSEGRVYYAQVVGQPLRSVTTTASR